MQYKNINYFHFEKIDSTNRFAKAQATTFAQDRLTCVIADEQSSAHGTYGKKWLSPQGNLAVSLCFFLPQDSSIVKHMAQFTTLCCAQVLKKKGFSPKIKWPNDLLLEKKKVAGVLVETVALKDVLCVIVGIGMNLNIDQKSLAQLDQPATSLSEQIPQVWHVEEILEPLLKLFIEDLQMFKKEGFSAFADSYAQFSNT